MPNLLPNYIVNQVKQQVYEGSFTAISLFADISGFTATTEELMKHGEEGAEILSDILKYLFDTPVAAVYGFGGFITRYAGDAFTALFEINGNQQAIAQKVLQTALEIIHFFEANKVYQSKFGSFEFGVKVGLAYGSCQWGITGSDNEKSYYFKGEAVDYCAEAEHNAEKGQIWLSEPLYNLLQEHIPVSSKAVLHNSNYYHAQKIESLSAVRESAHPVNAGKQMLYMLAGKKESEFPVGEFREIVSVFIAFQETENLKQLMQTVYHLRDIYGGSHPVLDFGDKGGNILLFFGTPTAYENNGTRALNFIWQLKKECLDNFVIRAGLCQGIVYCGFNGAELHREFTCLGNTVNQSARFMMKAGWNEIWLDDCLAAVSGFNFHSLGNFEFKGRAGKIAAFALNGRIEDLEITFAGNFIERKKELKTIVNRFQHFSTRKGCGVFYLDGDAGCGKSRLVYQVKSFFPQSSTQWCYLPSDDIIKAGFNPIISFIKKLAAISEENEISVNCRRFDSLITDLLAENSVQNQILDFEVHKDFVKNLLGLPVGNPEFELLEAEERYTGTLAAIKSFFLLLCSSKNLVLEFDNAQHLDQDTQNFIRHFITSGTKIRITIIFPCRLQDNGELFDFGLKDAVNYRLPLKNFNRNQIKSLVKDRLSLKKIPVKTVDVIAERSSGNPLFAEQIIRYLVENQLFDSSYKINSTKEIPTGINQIVVSRIDKLKKYLRELVKTAAVVGHQFSAAILGKMLNDKYKNLQELLSEGENEDIWQAVSKINYLFKYAVVHDVVYDMQLKKTVKELHLLSAQTIEKSYPDKISQFYEVLAYHYDKAEATTKAMQYLKLAGLQCKENYQNKKAAGYLDKWTEYADIELGISSIGWENLKKTSDNESLLREYGKVCIDRFYFYGLVFLDFSTSEVILKNLKYLSNLLNEYELNSSYIVDYINYKINMADYFYAIDVIKSSLISIEEKADYEKLAILYFNLGKIYAKINDYENAILNLETAEKITEIIPGNYKKMKLLAKVFSLFGTVYDMSGDLKLSIEYYNKQLNLCKQTKDKSEMSLALGNIGIIHHINGEYNKARDYYLQKINLCEELYNDKELALTLNNLGYLENDCGKANKAVAYYKKSIKILEKLNDQESLPNSICNLATVYKQMKNFTEAEDNYMKAHAIAEQISQLATQAEIEVELSELFYLTGRTRQATELLDKGLANARKSNHQDMVNKGMELRKIIN